MDTRGGFNNKLAKVIQFINQEIPGSRPGEITIDTDLRGDLRMLPEDADNFMEKFAETFGVSAGDFELTRYFPLEGSFVTALLGGFVRKRQNGHRPVRLTVGMLAGAACDGIWRTQALEQEFS